MPKYRENSPYLGTEIVPTPTPKCPQPPSQDKWGRARLHLSADAASPVVRGPPQTYPYPVWSCSAMLSQRAKLLLVAPPSSVGKQPGAVNAAAASFPLSIPLPLRKQTAISGCLVANK